MATEKAERGKKPHEDTRVAIWPMGFEDALRRVLAAPPPPDKARRSGKRDKDGSAQDVAGS